MFGWRPRLAVSLVVLTCICASPAAAQTVPPVVRFAGTLPVRDAPVLATFTLYPEASGGEPLWSETQAVSVDASGRYAVLLGATRADGVPRELFATGAARWVGVRIDGEAELPRVLLASAPYALKAGDAETIGGKPLSAFVLAGEQTGIGADGLTYVNPSTLGAALGGAFTPTANAGTANYLGRFTNATDLGNSALYQNGSSIGLGTTTPAAPFHVVSATAPAAFFDVVGSLGALPSVNRAARGTPAAPTAVQTDDILGGLAVRGYGATGFGQGVGQVMFRAAEAFTDRDQGTYLQMTTTPIGSTTWVERLRITPGGNVGIGMLAPAQKLSVAGTIESTTGGFKFPDGSTQTTAATGSGGNYVDLTSSQTIGGTKTFTNPIVGSITGNAATVTNGVYANGTYADPAWLTGLSGRKITTAGSNNTAVGAGAFYANTSGAMNSAFGVGSLGANTAGTHNAAFGMNALASATTAQFNSALGTYSLTNTTASNNTGVGYQAGTYNTTGANNTFLGANAGPDASHTGLSFATAVGASARVTMSNTLALGGTGAAAVNVVVGDTAPAPTDATVQPLLTLRKDAAGVLGPTLTLYNGAGYGGAGGGIDFFTTATGGTTPAIRVRSSDNNYSADLVFSTKTPGGGALTERMRLLNDGSLGIGTNAPTSRLHVLAAGDAITGYGPDHGVVGLATNPFGIGVNGASSGISGIGVLGVASSTADPGTMQSPPRGVYGRSDSPRGIGVEAVASSLSGESYAIKAFNASSSGVGAYVHSDGFGGVDIQAPYGNWGLRASSVGYGVLGTSASGGGIAVAGLTSGSNVTAIYGSSTSAAGWFQGPVTVNGPLTKSSGAFKIDHPLDPANKYLLHSFVESPDMKNVYDGVALLDERGQAVITLPDWFEALNKDFRYQLTPIGAFMPLYVADEIAQNRFRIAGGTPGRKVSWQVTGIRHDAYADAHRIPVEADKTGDQQGRYLHPEAFGQPATLSVDPQREAAAKAGAVGQGIQ